MKDISVNILGSEWTIKIGDEVKYPNLSEMDGYADSSVKEIVVYDMKKAEGQTGAKRNLIRLRKVRFLNNEKGEKKYA